jgi:hypothetical protein
MSWNRIVSWVGGLDNLRYIDAFKLANGQLCNPKPRIRISVYSSMYNRVFVMSRLENLTTPKTLQESRPRRWRLCQLYL